MWIGPHHAAGSVGHATMQPAGAGIVDSVDNLKAYSPQYPQSIVLIAEGAGASAAALREDDTHHALAACAETPQNTSGVSARQYLVA